MQPESKLYMHIAFSIKFANEYILDPKYIQLFEIGIWRPLYRYNLHQLDIWSKQKHTAR